MIGQTVHRYRVTELVAPGGLVRPGEVVGERHSDLRRYELAAQAFESRDGHAQQKLR